MRIKLWIISRLTVGIGLVVHLDGHTRSKTACHSFKNFETGTPVKVEDAEDEEGSCLQGSRLNTVTGGGAMYHDGTLLAIKGRVTAAQEEE
jgi:hypothetical protein